MRVTTLLVKKGTHKALLGFEKPSKMEDEWVVSMFEHATIILCLSEKILYNVMNKKITAGL